MRKKFLVFIKTYYFNIMLFFLYFSISIIMYSNYIMKGQIPVSGDALGFYRIKEIIKIAVSEGEFPLWNRYLLNGIPFAGDLNGVFNPITWICAFLPMQVQVYVYYSLHIAIGAFFTFLFCRELGLLKINSILAGILYATSIYLNGYRKGHIMLIVTIVYFPAVLYSIEKYLKEKKRIFLFLSAIFLALSFFEGFPQVQLYMDIVAGIYFVIRLVMKKEPWKRMCKIILGWGCTFTGLIMVQLIPTLEEMIFYSAGDALSMTWEEFSLFAMHPIKILMSFFPELFLGNITTGMGGYNSSEMDIEIYLGGTLALICVIGIINFFKDWRIRVLSVLAGMSFLFSCAPHIPVLGRLIFQIPLLGSFRCCSRALFIYVFFMIIIYSIVVQNIMEEKSVYKMAVVLKKVFVGFSILMLCNIPFVLSTANSDNELQNIAHNLKESLLEPYLILSATFFFVILINYLLSKRKEVGWLNNFFALGLAIMILVEILPYSLMTSASENDALINVSGKKYYSLIKDELENGKVIVANNCIDGAYESLFSSELGVHYKIPTLNAYIALNNPRIYKLLSPNGVVGPKKNFSGLYTGFEEIKRNLQEDNDILSMMGIKYILDPIKYIEESGKQITGYSIDKVLLEESGKKIHINGEDNIVGFSKDVNVDSNNYYVCKADIDNKMTAPVHVYFDLYSASYDNSEQQKEITLQTGKNSIEFLLPSNEVPENEVVSLRLVSIEECDLELELLEFSSCTIMEQQVYKLILDDGNERIYENLNAKDVLYVPSEVVKVKDFDDLYINQKNYDFDDVSYITDVSEFKVFPAELEDINWKNNSISAKVTSVGTSFVNFSNNYYPGWKAYIDGKETEVLEVNGLIQGICVPKGNHMVEFKYRPNSIYLGSFLSILTIITNLFLVKRDKRNSMKV